MDYSPPFPLHLLPPRGGIFLRFVFADEATDRTIIGTFTLGREDAAGKLFHPPVIGDTLTASALPITGLIGTGASSLVLF
jgi:hypothetical protein